MDYATEAYLQFNTVLRDEGAILDVERIKLLDKVHKDTIVKTNTGKEVSIDLNYLSVLIMDSFFQFLKR